jgi:indole-3-glycerol phosphate synthase
MKPSILQKIKNYKIKEIQTLKDNIGTAFFEKEAFNKTPPLGFLNKLNTIKLPKINIIAEIKKASPSKGIICHDFVPIDIAKSYEKYGASCISILTDNPSFQGKNEDLINVKQNSNIPILRKEFIFDEIQVYESRAIGSDCILIIMAALTDNEAKCIEKKAIELGMDVILEIHNQKELERALLLNSKLIGINNRDLNSFITNLNTTADLIKFIPNDYLVISESGISTKDDIKFIMDFEVNSFLIGENFMKSNNLEQEFLKLLDI